MMAVRTDQVGVAELLLANGADVNAADLAGVTSLHVAAAYGRIRLVELLLAHGAAVDAKASIGETPLFWAASFGQAYVIALLVKHGASLATHDRTGRTPLQAAMRNDNQDAWMMLHDLGEKE